MRNKDSLKMVLQPIWSFVVISALALSVNAFWWNPASTTETPTQNMKQIPLGYFRTYTYQPVGAQVPYSFSIVGTAPNPFNWQAKLPVPSLFPDSRYELYPLPASTEQAKLSPTTTTTTTTTSTAPPSPPPPSIPTQPPQVQAQDRMATPLINSPNSINMGSKYFEQIGAYSQYQNLYNRRSLPYYQGQTNFYRPYPYPSYSTPNQKSSVQFVPCMCPISIASGPSDLTERRTVPDGDDIILLDATDSVTENASTADNIVELGVDADKKSVR